MKKPPAVIDDLRQGDVIELPSGNVLRLTSRGSRFGCAYFRRLAVRREGRLDWGVIHWTFAYRPEVTLDSLRARYWGGAAAGLRFTGLLAQPRA